MKKLMKGLLLIAALGGPGLAAANDTDYKTTNDTTQAADKTTQAAKDDEITTKVENKLSNDSMLKSDHIQVSTKKGKVELSGSVTSEQERDRALSLAKKTAGVEAVHNKLTVHKG